MATTVSAPRTFLTAEWRYLALLNYRIDPRVLVPLVPAGTSLDLWQGEAIVSLVGFRFLSTRVLRVPIPMHRDFDEVNLRFYVRAESGGDVRRGVTFIREIVPRRAIALLARLAYNEPYVALPMRSVVPRELTDSPGRVAYAWRSRGVWNRLAVTPEGPSKPLEAGSEAEFITEHYWGYTRQRDRGTIEYEVSHPRWRTWCVSTADLECDVAGLYGSAFVEPLARPPQSAFLAEGSPITVSRPRRWAALDAALRTG